MRLAKVIVIGIFVAAGLGAAFLWVTRLKSLPEYRIEPGQKLVYASSYSMKGPDRSSQTESEHVFWAVADNPDGSTRLCFRSKERSIFQGQGIDQGTEYGRLDLFPDGRIDNAMPAHHNFSRIGPFFRLPSSVQEMRQGWEYSLKRMQDSMICSPIHVHPLDRRMLVYRVEPHSPLDAFFSHLDFLRVVWSRSRGVVREVTFRTTGTANKPERGEGRMVLKEVSWTPEQERTGYLAELGTYLEACGAYVKSCQEHRESRPLTADPQALDVWATAYDTLDAPLKAITESIHEPSLREELEQRIGAHSSMRKYEVDGWRNKAGMIGKAMPAWETTDLDGQTHRLEQYRGKALLLDFGYRGCGYCVLAYPMMKDLHQRFSDKPFALLHMSTDEKEEDMRFVAETAQFPYPTLKAKTISEQCQISAAPTFVIVDQQGILRYLHEGVPENTEETLRTAIQRLLEENESPSAL